MASSSIRIQRVLGEEAPLTVVRCESIDRRVDNVSIYDTTQVGEFVLFLQTYRPYATSKTNANDALIAGLAIIPYRVMIARYFRYAACRPVVRRLS